MRLLRLAPILVFALLPAIGILFLGWDWREVLVLYWCENVGLGVAIAVRILHAPLADAREGGDTRGGSLITFCLYYGLFTVVHGLFVFAIVGGALNGIVGVAPDPDAANSLDWPSILVVTVVGTAVHIAAALAQSAPIRPRERMIMTAFQRVQVLHVAILAGGFLIAVLRLPSATALVLVALHASVDVVTWWATGATARPPGQYEPRHLNQEEPDPES